MNPRTPNAGECPEPDPHTMPPTPEERMAYIIDWILSDRPRRDDGPKRDLL